jgi:hypothetical protein
VLLDPAFGLEMRYAGFTVGAAGRGVDEVLDAGGLGRVGEYDALQDFLVQARGHRILHAEHAMGAGQRGLEGTGVSHVPGEHLDSPGTQGPGLAVLRIAGQGSDVEALRVPREGIDDGAALVTGGARDQDGRRLVVGCRVWQGHWPS